MVTFLRIAAHQAVVQQVVSCQTAHAVDPNHMLMALGRYWHYHRHHHNYHHCHHKHHHCHHKHHQAPDSLSHLRWRTYSPGHQRLHKYCHQYLLEWNLKMRVGGDFSQTITSQSSALWNTNFHDFGIVQWIVNMGISIKSRSFRWTGGSWEL